MFVEIGQNLINTEKVFEFFRFEEDDGIFSIGYGEHDAIMYGTQEERDYAWEDLKMQLKKQLTMI